MLIGSASSQIRIPKGLQVPNQVAFSPVIDCSHAVSCEDPFSGIRVPFANDVAAGIRRLVVNQTSEGNDVARKFASMVNGPRCYVCDSTTVVVHAKARTGVGPIAWWQPCIYQ